MSKIIWLSLYLKRKLLALIILFGLIAKLKFFFQLQNEMILEMGSCTKKLLDFFRLTQGFPHDLWMAPISKRWRGPVPPAPPVLTHKIPWTPTVPPPQPRRWLYFVKSIHKSLKKYFLCINGVWKSSEKFLYHHEGMVLNSFNTGFYHIGIYQRMAQNTFWCVPRQGSLVC